MGLLGKIFKKVALKAMDKDPKLNKLTKDAQDSIERLQKHAKWKVQGADSDLWTRK